MLWCTELGHIDTRRRVQRVCDAPDDGRQQNGLGQPQRRGRIGGHQHGRLPRQVRGTAQLQAVFVRSGEQAVQNPSRPSTWEAE